MNKTIDNETLLLKVESHDHRIEVLENLLNVAKEVLTLEEAALFMLRFPSSDHIFHGGAVQPSWPRYC